jgi:hypothetical protein
MGQPVFLATWFVFSRNIERICIKFQIHALKWLKKLPLQKTAGGCTARDDYDNDG